MKYTRNTLNFISQGPDNISYITFIEKGWKQERDNKLPINSILDAKNIELYPEIVSFLFLNINTFFLHINIF